MPDTIRIGIVGAGGIARQRHLPGFKRIAGAEVVSVVNRSRESSERIAGEFDVPRVHDHWAELVADPEIDAVVIGTWPYQHCPITVAALAAGKHVLTEGRMALSAAQAREMLAASRRHPHLVTQIVPGPFTFPVDLVVPHLLADGYLGALQAIDLRSPAGWLDPSTPMSWRHDRELSGVNTGFLGIWYESLMRWFGPATTVTARTRIAVPYRLDERGERRAMQIPDHVEVLADMPGGAIARLHVGSVAGLMPGPELWLFGSEGTLRFEMQGAKLSGARKGEKELSPIEIPEDRRYAWRVEDEFIGAIRGEEPVRRTTFADGVRYMDFTEAVHISAKEGRTIYLPNSDL
jgi:predicted dehydrogenase